MGFTQQIGKAFMNMEQSMRQPHEFTAIYESKDSRQWPLDQSND